MTEGYVNIGGCLISLFYIKPQHEATKLTRSVRCLISLFYIKPQLCTHLLTSGSGCLISLFYIKPQLYKRWYRTPLGCLISLFYIKPQLQQHLQKNQIVVLYLFSTSNHNLQHLPSVGASLSYISFLHQTTTFKTCFW